VICTNNQSNESKLFAQLKEGIKQSSPVAVEIAGRLAKKIFQKHTIADGTTVYYGSVSARDSIAKEFGFSQAEANELDGLVRPFLPPDDPVVYDTAGRSGTESNVRTREGIDKIVAVTTQTTGLGGLAAAIEGAMGGTAEDINNARKAGDTAEQILDGASKALSARRQQVKSAKDSKPSTESKPMVPPPPTKEAIASKLQSQVNEVKASLVPFQGAKSKYRPYLPYQLQVGGATGFLEGQQVTSITVSNPRAYQLFKDGILPLPQGTILGPMPLLVKNGEIVTSGGRLPIGMHVERLTIGHLEDMGVRGGFTTSSGLACKLCAPEFDAGKLKFPTWTHLQQYEKYKP